MNAPLKTADLGILSIYLTRDPTGAIVINDEQVEDFAKAAARRRVQLVADFIAAGSTMAPATYEDSLPGARNNEMKRAELELYFAKAGPQPLSPWEQESLMSGKYTRD